VLAPTLPGSLDGPPVRLRGRSLLAFMADHVEELLDEQGWTEPVSVAGSSFGGVIAVELAARGRARNVVALAPPWLGVKTSMLYGSGFVAAQTSLRVVDRVLPRLMRSRAFGSLLLHGSLQPMTLDGDELAVTLRSFERFPLLRVFSEMRWPSGMLPDFARVRAPVLIAWGTRDNLAPYSMSRQWAAALPEAELVTLPGFPHVPHLRDPTRIADLIMEASERPTKNLLQGAAA
jgi:pimeloyl-ACP methyl ester carboxylesterase